MTVRMSRYSSMRSADSDFQIGSDLSTRKASTWASKSMLETKQKKHNTLSKLCNALRHADTTRRRHVDHNSNACINQQTFMTHTADHNRHFSNQCKKNRRGAKGWDGRGGKLA